MEGPVDCTAYLGRGIHSSHSVYLTAVNLDCTIPHDCKSGPLGPGSYSVISNKYPYTSGPQATVEWLVLDAQCNATEDTEASLGGTLTITGSNPVPGGRIAGTFDVTLGTDHVTGSFDTFLCPEPNPINICY